MSTESTINSTVTTTTTTEHSNQQTMHQLDANATPFDPIGNSVGQMDGNSVGQMDDKQFIIFSQLQQLNTVLQQLQYQLQISIQQLTPMNQQMFNANINQLYITNPLLYTQLQQQQNLLMQTVQSQQTQSNQMKNQINMLQNQYEYIKQQQIKQLISKHNENDNDNNNNNNNNNIIIVNQPETIEIRNKQLSAIEENEKEGMKEEYKEEIREIKEHTPQSCIEEKVIEQVEYNDKTDGEIENNDTNNVIKIIKYSPIDLIKHQSKCMDIDWLNNQQIPRDIRMIYKDKKYKDFMTHIIASITRKCENSERTFYNRKISQDKKSVYMRKLQLTLNKMTPTKYDKISSATMDIIGEYVMNKEEMEHILGMILDFGVKQSIFSDQYAKLIEYIFNNLPYVNENISSEFRGMVIMESNKLFKKYRNNKLENKKPFVAFLKLCGDLFNINMMKRSVIYKGIIDTLIKDNICSIDIEAICMLFKECGDKLDYENTKCVSEYLKKIIKLSKQFDFRTRCLIDGVKEMREKDWTHRIKKEKPKDLNEIKKEFEEEQQRIEDAKYNKYKDYNSYSRHRRYK